MKAEEKNRKTADFEKAIEAAKNVAGNEAKVARLMFKYALFLDPTPMPAEKKVFENYEGALNIYKSLAVDEPKYIPFVGRISETLGFFYENCDRDEEAKEMYQLSLYARRYLHSKNELKYVHDYAYLLYSVAFFFDKLSKPDLTNYCFQLGIKILTHALDIKACERNKNLLLTLNNSLSQFYVINGRFSDAIEQYELSLKIIDELITDYGNKYLEEKARCLKEIRRLCPTK